MARFWVTVNFYWSMPESEGSRKGTGKATVLSDRTQVLECTRDRQHRTIGGKET